MNRNGIDNPALTIENSNCNIILSNENIQSEDISNEHKIPTIKNSPLMFISLTLHSLGIIFGDM